MGQPQLAALNERVSTIDHCYGLNQNQVCLADNDESQFSGVRQLNLRNSKENVAAAEFDIIDEQKVAACHKSKLSIASRD